MNEQDLRLDVGGSQPPRLPHSLSDEVKSAEPQKKTGPLPLVYCIGDSISVHYGPHLERSLRGIFRYDRMGGEKEALLDLDVPRGANGGSSSRVLEYLSARLKQGGFHPDFLLLNCGLHDIKRNAETGQIEVPIERYRANLIEIIALCAGAGIRLVWVRTTPVADEIHNRPGTPFLRHARDVDAYNLCADGLMRESHVSVIDLHTFTCGLAEALFCDHVHFHESIRQEQGRFLARCLIDLL